MEKSIQTDSHLAVGALPGITLFRNNTGMGWAGELIRKYPNGSVELANARPLHAGLCTGSSDLIGFTSVVITPEMVGKKIAVFTALEVKTPTGRTSNEQLNFLRAVLSSGGIAKVVKTPDEARQALSSAQ